MSYGSQHNHVHARGIFDILFSLSMGFPTASWNWSAVIRWWSQTRVLASSLWTFFHLNLPSFGCNSASFRSAKACFSIVVVAKFDMTDQGEVLESIGSAQAVQSNSSMSKYSDRLDPRLLSIGDLFLMELMKVRDRRKPWVRYSCQWKATWPTGQCKESTWSQIGELDSEMTIRL